MLRVYENASKLAYLTPTLVAATMRVILPRACTCSLHAYILATQITGLWYLARLPSRSARATPSILSSHPSRLTDTDPPSRCAMECRPCDARTAALSLRSHSWLPVSAMILPMSEAVPWHLRVRRALASKSSESYRLNMIST
ncbi:hypothetical protein BD309DRAFT_971899 [Dichomitus squalens]|uniref:Uncharacterized protein n=1 Tax=Dichomitus squalens TaxID=114155 RepID=A0A4Q9NDG1_9APHY|nr:hypothetical protein BD309DRAFT_971899 [Dichomitus squalens]TBU52588.1 hypothetical protein BD310DRAFT_939960 [Dichomitus squalens]